ncbi:TetR/AcrR family transcriptional regulator [Agrilactobacillus yilanensis]|uniref:TetR/AcrR family transcriptional regulator n=1 Tax=Agrilactobacillus yilanensis TaxID=2485997 RepID=A0ABW4J982_9LACO|nr:TetR/AcrR family transcriptional regulator [Agrilactobacillus yilanensis]
MAKKQDLRVIRTRKMIVDAFIKLVQENGFENLTVQEIADEAMINRATFYAHFKDKQDLYHYVFSFALDSIKEVLSIEILTTDHKVDISNVENMLSRFFRLAQDNRGFFKILTSSNNTTTLTETLRSVLQERYAEIFDNLEIKQGQTLIPTSFIIDYMTSIFVGILHWWLNNNSDFSPEHMAKLVIQLIANGHLTVMGVEMTYDPSHLDKPDNA